MNTNQLQTPDEETLRSGPREDIMENCPKCNQISKLGVIHCLKPALSYRALKSVENQMYIFDGILKI
jgi:hypothetical protein